jgi:hypothetical protein
MKGLYLLTEFFNDKKIPYVHIKGSTRDNFHLDPSQLALLEKLYTEEEARAYLDGEFVNLSTGRVYAEFDPSKHTLKECIVPTQFEQLYVAQDFNVGYNACTVHIVRDGVIYEVSEHHWSVVGDGPRQLRMLYPDNPMIYIPDVSGKELIHAYSEEFDAYGIERVWSNVNPPINDRVLAINKACRVGKFFVNPSCKKSILGLQTRGFDDNGKPTKGKGPDALDHHGDCIDYAVWHIIHSVAGFETILSLLRGQEAFRYL